jgi:hypothetical protein
MHQRLKVLHNSLSLKLENLERANRLLTNVCIERKQIVTKNINVDNNIYDIVLTFDKDDDLEHIIKEIMKDTLCTPCASGSFEEGKTKLIYTLYL